MSHGGARRRRGHSRPVLAAAAIVALVVAPAAAGCRGASAPVSSATPPATSIATIAPGPPMPSASLTEPPTEPPMPPELTFAAAVSATLGERYGRVDDGVVVEEGSDQQAISLTADYDGVAGSFTGEERYLENGRLQARLRLVHARGETYVTSAEWSGAQAGKWLRVPDGDPQPVTAAFGPPVDANGALRSLALLPLLTSRGAADCHADDGSCDYPVQASAGDVADFLDSSGRVALAGLPATALETPLAGAAHAWGGHLTTVTLDLTPVFVAMTSDGRVSGGAGSPAELHARMEADFSDFGTVPDVTVPSPAELLPESSPQA